MKFSNVNIRTPDYKYQIDGDIVIVISNRQISPVLEMMGTALSIDAQSIDEALDLLEDVEKILTFVKG